MPPLLSPRLCGAGFAAAACCVAIDAPTSLRAQATPRADIVLYHGTVLTVDATDRVAQAVAIAGQRIVAVGSDAEVLRLAGPTTRRIDLMGRTVTPGLLDAHAHFANAGADRLFVVNVGYPDVKSIGDMVSRVALTARKGPAHAWVEGRGRVPGARVFVMRAAHD